MRGEPYLINTAIHRGGSRNVIAFNRFNGFAGANGWNRSGGRGAASHRDSSRC